MRIIFFTLVSFFIAGCQSGTPHSSDSLTFVPTIKLQQGTTKTIDMSVYKKEPNTVVSFNSNAELQLKFDPDSEMLTLTAGSVNNRLITLNGASGKSNFTIPVQIIPMAEHTFTFNKEESISKVVVMGGFNDWSRSALPMLDIDNDGILERTVYLAPQRHEYKFVVDSEEMIDPDNPVFISNNIGGWNSILDLSEKKETPAGYLIKESAVGRKLIFTYLPPKDNATLNTFFVTLDNQIVPENEYSYKNNIFTFQGAKNKTGTLRILSTDSKGRILPENITILNNGRPIDPINDPDDWHFAIIYNMMVDRFNDGDPTNNDPIIHPDLHPLANFQGGDLKGIHEKITDGYLSDLSVNAIWISPLQKQPDLAYREWIPPNRVFTGYHGYWPVQARELEPRFGTSDEFHDLVGVAHENNIRILLDFVTNHVHEEHHYYKDHRDWFGDVTLSDGSMNIRNWSEETRLTTWFDEFIPSFDYPSAPEAIDSVVADAMWWLNTYNLDGFRQDAVKHVPHAFWKSLGKKLKETYPNRYFYQIGETFGSDELIGSYVNPLELSAQFNFSIYFNARGPLSEDKPSFSHLSESISNNNMAFGPVHLMGNITSSHDQLRFMSYADKQLRFSDNGTERSFIDPPGNVKNSVSYKKLNNFHALNFSLPGIPVIYYGEEIGLMGAGDPGNRRMMRFDEKLNSNEKWLLESLKEIAGLRKVHPSLSIGDWIPIMDKDETFIYKKSYFNEKILVVIHQGPENREIQIPIIGKRLIDLNNGDRFRIENNRVSTTLAPYSYHFFQVEK